MRLLFPHLLPSSRLEPFNESQPSDRIDCTWIQDTDILLPSQVFLNIVLDEAVEEKAGGEKVRIGMVVRSAPHAERLRFHFAPLLYTQHYDEMGGLLLPS